MVEAVALEPLLAAVERPLEHEVPRVVDEAPQAYERPMVAPLVAAREVLLAAAEQALPCEALEEVEAFVVQVASGVRPVVEALACVQQQVAVEQLAYVVAAVLEEQACEAGAAAAAVQMASEELVVRAHAAAALVAGPLAVPPLPGEIAPVPFVALCRPLAALQAVCPPPADPWACPGCSDPR